ncbi:MAG: hypothetical protein AAF317_13305 [Pseudomonadota bacterium]
MNTDDLKSAAGQLLYRELPEEYRYQDPAADGELGDLEAYLHGFGHLLDLIRGTTEQAYADAFAEEADNGREIQTWLIPYLAELVGAELRAPDPDARREELNQTVNWYKSKGSLEAVDEISDTISNAETVVLEGWRSVLTTPRMALPPFTADAAARGSGDPLDAPGLPQGSPDLRLMNRAIEDPDGVNPLHLVRLPQRDAFGRESAPDEVFWRPSHRRGAPCNPGAYDDTSVRTPDLRLTGAPHPMRTQIHVRPPEGFFATGLNGTELAPTVDDLGIDPDETAEQVIGPAQVFANLGVLDPGTVESLEIDGVVEFPDRILITGDLNLPDGVNIRFEDLLFSGVIRVQTAATALTLERCAVERVVVEVPTDEPALIATDCLFNRIRGGVGFGQLVYCTVLGPVELERLWASDCIFAQDLIDLNCSEDRSCIRYSRVPDLSALSGCSAELSPSNTDHDPNFIRLWFEAGDDCILRPAEFGEPGCGVLDLTSSPAIRAGAEDEGEMGAYHHMFHAAQIRALELKLSDTLPLGQDVAIRYDPMLARRPVTLS